MTQILSQLLRYLAPRASHTDRYLNEATTLADLENRIRVIERHGLPTGNWGL